MKNANVRHLGVGVKTKLARCGWEPWRGSVGSGITLNQEEGEQSHGRPLLPLLFFVFYKCCNKSNSRTKLAWYFRCKCHTKEYREGLREGLQ